MSVLIDLAAYLAEVKAFVPLAERFAEDRASQARLHEVQSNLSRGLGLGLSEWTWHTPQPIVFRKSYAYDGPDRKDVEAHLTFGFECVFWREARTSKGSTVWQIKHCATHVCLYKGGNVLPCHFDYKNKGQWGPQMHFQISEDVCDISIPRVPSGFFLPTDCADLALAELHHEEWRKEQAASRSSHGVALIRKAQENRVLSYLEDVRHHWRQDTRSTRACMLQNYTSTVAGLPDHHGRVAKQP